jgi:hypothetical protein
MRYEASPAFIRFPVARKVGADSVDLYLVVEVCHAGSLDHPWTFKSYGGDGKVVEEADAGTEQHWYQAHLDPIQQPHVETLLGDIGTGDSDHPFTGDSFRLRHRACNPIGDEREGWVQARPAVWNGVGDDKHGHTDWVLTAPAVGVVEQTAATD